MSGSASRPTLLVVGGLGGLLGRALAPEVISEFRVRSLHRHLAPSESQAGVEWVPGDVATITDWAAPLNGVDLVVNLAWYRAGQPSRFRGLYEGLHRMLEQARQSGVRRIVHLSVPEAPSRLERELPYLRYKRQFDAELRGSGISHRILRPSAMFGPGDVLLSVMLRSIARYPLFPMFGDGAYHLSPVAAADVARAVRLELSNTESGTADVGGPHRYGYRQLTDRMFELLGEQPRYWSLTPRGGVRLARLLEIFGSSLLYAYEVEWLLSDMLGLPPYGGLDRPLTAVDAYLVGCARGLRPPTRPGPAAPPGSR